MITREGISAGDAMAYLLRSKHGAVIKIQAGRLPVPRPELKAELYGISGSPGIAVGAAWCITSYEQLGEVREGEILVAPAATPSWSMVFGLVKGVIVASGGSLAHAAIVGREYGIPLVTNVFDGIYKIK